MSDKLSKPLSIVEIHREEVKKLLENIPENARADYENHYYESKFFQSIADDEAPADMLKERKGSWDKEKNDYTTLEYFPEDYTLSELDRIFPGWWVEEYRVHTDLMDRFRTLYCTGYLCVKYPTPKGEQVTKRPAIGSTRVEYTKEDHPALGMKDASQVDDRLKAVRTEWIKLAGKWYGIGLEVYHQRITTKLRAKFEDIVRDWGHYADEVKKIASTFETGHGFRKFLQSLPHPELTERIKTALNGIPETQNDKGQTFQDIVWTQFVKLRLDTQANRKQAEDFIRKIEEKATIIKQKTKEE